MILVTLGTQDKKFERLLKAIDLQIEKGIINEEVIVQAGSTKYESKNMKIFDLLPIEDFNKYLKDANFIITHGGVGTILTGLKLKKKMIVIPRLKRYEEHENDHQIQIVDQFVAEGYVLTCDNLNRFDKVLRKVNSFKPKEYTGNNKRMLNILTDYIDNTKENKRCEILLYLFFGGLTTLINILVFWLFNSLIKLPWLGSNIIAWVAAVLFAYFTNKKYVFDSTNKNKIKEFISFISFRLITLGIDMAFMYLFIDIWHISDMVSKVVISVIVIVLNYIFSKLFTFKKSVLCQIVLVNKKFDKCNCSLG